MEVDYFEGTIPGYHHFPYEGLNSRVILVFGKRKVCWKSTSSPCLLRGKPQPKPANGLSAPLHHFVSSLFHPSRLSLTNSWYWHVHKPTNAWQIITQQNPHNRNTPQGVTNSRLWRHSIIIRVLSRVLIVTLTVCGSICGCHLLQQMRFRNYSVKGGTEMYKEYLFNIFSESFLSSLHNLFLSTLMNLTFTHSRVAPKLQIICKLPPTSELLVLPTKTMCSWGQIPQNDHTRALVVPPTGVISWSLYTCIHKGSWEFVRLDPSELSSHAGLAVVNM